MLKADAVVVKVVVKKGVKRVCPYELSLQSAPNLWDSSGGEPMAVFT